MTSTTEPQDPEQPAIEVVDEAVDGDPFWQRIRCDGKDYLFNEAALIKMFHRNDETFLANLFGTRRA